MRLTTPEVRIGKIKMGGNNPVVIQSMTDTDTADAESTALQCMELFDAGSEVVRITVNTDQAAESVPEIRKILDLKGYDGPLVGDFHYNGHLLLERYPECASALAKYRINPGNVGFGDKHEYNFSKIIHIALQNDKPVRIGVNWGSLDQDLLTEMMEQNQTKTDREVVIDAMVESAWRSAKLAQSLGMNRDKIILSVKMSELPDMVKAYELLASRMQETDEYFPLHLGLTEAGGGLYGVVSSSAALAILLNKGIGDTIRVSITPESGQSRTREVEVCKALLQSLGLRNFEPRITSCPGCGRTSSNFFKTLAEEINIEIKKRLPEWKQKYKDVENLRIAVMGCVVNGPGEAKYADIAISLPGKMEKQVAPVYIKGKFVKSLEGENIKEEFMDIIDKYLKNNIVDY